MIKSLSHLPVIADPSHSTGRAQLVTPMTLAAVAAGAHGIIVDVHPNPAVAKCDGAQALTFDKFEDMMAQATAVAQAVGKVPTGTGR
jgi:3-deoxy-7-phosphoheptulonate synthase